MVPQTTFCHCMRVSTHTRIHRYIYRYIKQCINKSVRFPHPHTSPWFAQFEIYAAWVRNKNSPSAFLHVWESLSSHWRSRLMMLPGSWLHLRTPSQEAMLGNSCSGAPSPSDQRSDRSSNLQKKRRNEESELQKDKKITLFWTSQIWHAVSIKAVSRLRNTARKKQRQRLGTSTRNMKTLCVKWWQWGLPNICCPRHKRLTHSNHQDWRVHTLFHFHSRTSEK